MLYALMPASIMFSITVLFVSLFFTPAMLLKLKNKVMEFYWVGFWLFLGMIAAMAGAQSTLLILGYDVSQLAESVLFAITLSFVIFVIFAWFRLSSTALIHGVVTIKRKFR